MRKSGQFSSYLRTRSWFIPSLFIAAGVLLVLLLLQAGASRNHLWPNRWPRLFGAGADGKPEPPAYAP